MTGRIFAHQLERDGVLPTPEGCRAVRQVLRDHGRPMSFSLIRSRLTVPMSPELLAACLIDLILEQEVAGLNEHDLYDLDEFYA